MRIKLDLQIHFIPIGGRLPLCGNKDWKRANRDWNQDITCKRCIKKKPVKK